MSIVGERHEQSRDRRIVDEWLAKNVRAGDDWRRAVAESVTLVDADDLAALVEASDAAAERLDQQLNEEQKEDVAIVAARVQAQGAVKAAEISSRATTRASLIAFVGTVVGAAIGAGASNWLYDLIAT